MELVKTARNKGILRCIPNPQDPLGAPAKYEYISKEELDVFFERVGQCRSFLFFPEKKVATVMGALTITIAENAMKSMALEFNEALKKLLANKDPAQMTANPEAFSRNLQAEHCASPEFLNIENAPFNTFSIEEPDYIRQQKSILGNSGGDKCIMAVEKEPMIFDVYGLSDFNGKPEVTLNETTIRSFLKYYLDRLKIERVGNVLSKRTYNISGLGKRAQRVPLSYTLVCPKKSIEAATKSVGRKVDWRSRWLVRGHWMGLYTTDAEGKKIVDPTRIGKDREGNYHVKGYTWVIDHEKGPEDKPLINKPRIVKTVSQGARI